MGHPATLAQRLALLVHNRIDDSPDALMVLYGSSVATLWPPYSASVAALWLLYSASVAAH